MTENAPPGSSANTGADGSRGMPYYEKIRRDLRESLNKKRGIDAQLVSTAMRRALCLVLIPGAAPD